MIFKTKTKVSKTGDIDDIYLKSLKYQTPYFIFSEQKLKNKYAEFMKSFPRSLVHYAIKANAEPEVIKTLSQAGAGFEVASIYELNLLKAKKVDPKKIIYGSSVKPANHIKEFYKYGVRTFAADANSELEKIAAMAPGANVYVREAVNDAGSVFKFSEKFGTERENIVPLLIRAKELGLVPYGISFHVGSQASNPMAWAEAIKNLKEPIKQLKKAGIKIKVLNIGGGYPCMYASTEYDLSLKEIAHNTLSEYKKLPYKPKLMLEPGRGLVATSGLLVTSVIGRVERKGHTWLFLDAGVYNGLFETMAYQGSTRYRVTSMRPSYDSGEMLFALAGPTGDSPDIITREALL
jgi:ornithine decarboxylase